MARNTYSFLQFSNPIIKRILYLHYEDYRRVVRQNATNGPEEPHIYTASHPREQQQKAYIYIYIKVK
jgi:hypothetical protein